MSLRRVAAALSTAVLALSLSACSEEAPVEAPNTDATLVIGISGTTPGLSLMQSGKPVGFDVDVATYVAHALGWSDSDIEWKQLYTADRQTALNSGQVDMVVAAYSITDERAAEIDFAGPYFTAGQDLLVRMDNSDITGPHSLDGKVLCSTKGSTAAARVKTTEFSAGVNLKEYADNASCVDALLAGEVDAVTTDDVILAGFAQEHPTQLKVLGSPFSTENYGIGLPKGSLDVGAINTAINNMVADGSWRADFDNNLEKSGYVPPSAPVAGS